MPYQSYYVAVGGWQNRPDTDTPITSDALNHIEAGITAAQAAADTVAGQLSSYGPGGSAGNINKVTALGLAAAIQIALGDD